MCGLNKQTWLSSYILIGAWVLSVILAWQFNSPNKNAVVVALPQVLCTCHGP